MKRGIFIIVVILIGIVYGSEIVDMVENKTIPIQTFMHIKSKIIKESSSFIVFPGSLNPNNLGTCKSLNKTEFGANFTFPPASAILVFAYEGCTNDVHAKLVKDVGGSIAIIAAGIPYMDCVFKYGIDKIDIPVLFMTFPDAIILLKTMGKNSANGFPTILNFEKQHNTWETLGKGGFWIFLQIVLLTSYLFNFVVGIRSLILHFKQEGPKLNISQSTIWVNLFATFIWSMVMFDPWNMRYIVHQNFYQVIISLASPALLSSVILLSFFFNEVLIAKGFIKPQLSTLKYPFIIICLAFWACYIANAVIFGANFTNLSIVKIIIFMNILFFGLSGIYFLLTSILILIKLKGYDSPIFKRVLPLVSVVFFVVLLFVIASIIEASQVYSTFYGC
eukprot:TRINITY_DN912_c0_g2_i1.p1 TRINITY_DN912_c0_g2~~TRINITY_DN912_c0_g2_i1.p1  ORF type:complete len:391 (-),score=31.17 TRINITY_DN912_c0_g2_i1:269-1441(-)